MTVDVSRWAASSVLELARRGQALAVAVAAGWNVEHRPNGRHLFPWVRPSLDAIVTSTAWALTTRALLKYQVIDATMTLVFDLTGTVTGTPALLTFTLPDRYLSVESVSAGQFDYSDAGTAGTGTAIANGSVCTLYKDINATAWTAGTARVQGTISFEVTR